MLNLSRIISSLELLLIAAIVAVNAQAQSAQVFVSARNGDDGGNCTAALPCRTVNYALTQVQPGGQALIIDSGDYDSSIAITKSVTIAAAPGVTAIFSRAVNFGTIFSISGDSGTCDATGCYSVILRGLTFDGQGITQDAIRVSGLKLTVEDCTFSRVENGIYMNGSGTLHVKHSAFRGGARGIYIAPNESGKNLLAVVGNSHFEGQTVVGIQALIRESNTLKMTVYSSNIDRSGYAGVLSSIAASGGSAQVNLEECLITHGGIGVFSSSAGSIVRVSNSTIVGNNTGLTGNGALLTRGNNTVEGNRFNGVFTGTFSAK